MTKKRCVIGESPIWNDIENILYFTNGFGKELCRYDIATGKTTLVPLKKDCAAIAFGKSNRLIVSREDGVFALNKDGSTSPVYDCSKYEIKYANDMKAGPDGRLYVGTQSEKRLGISDNVNGKLYSIDKFGSVKVLLDGLRLSNGMDWSFDEKFFYHTDSDTGIIKEYKFDDGNISFSGRQIEVPGVDGFTVGRNNKLYIACWGQGHIAVADTKTLKIEEYLKMPCANPASCCFCGKDMSFLAVTTASYDTDISKDINAGFTILLKTDTEGRKPYLFG